MVQQIQELISKVPTIVMILPIILLWLVTLAVAVERYNYFRKRKVGKDFSTELSGFFNQGDILGAERLCSNEKNPVSCSLKAAFQLINKHKGNPDFSRKGANRELIKGTIEEIYKLIGNSQISLLEKHLTILSTIATIAPLFGLLGTVTGMLKSFNSLSTSISTISAKYAQEIAAGITEALLTTFLGLLVAIPAYIFYNYFINRINSISLEMERGLYLYLESFFSAYENKENK